MTGRFCRRRATAARFLPVLLLLAAACSSLPAPPSPFTSSPLASPLPTAGAQPGQAGQWLAKGDAFSKAGQYDQALAAYNQAIQGQENPARAYEGRGNANGGLRRFDDAVADYTESLKYQRDPRVLTSRCNAYRTLGNLAAAQTDCQDALALLPGDADTHAVLAEIYDAQDNSEAAHNEITTALELDPRSVNANFVQSQLATKAGQYDDAIAALSRCIELLPGQPNFYLQRGQLYLAQGKVDLAKADMNAVLQYGKPETDGEIMFQAGAVLSSIGARR